MSIALQIFANSIIAASIYFIIGAGFSLVYRTAKFFDLGYGAMIAVGGYGVFFLSQVIGLGSGVSIILGIGIAGCIGFGVERAVYARLRKRNATPMVLLVSALGVFITIQALLAIFFSSQFRVLAEGTQRTYELFGATITNIQVIIIAAAVCIGVGLILLLDKTKFGRAVKAIGDDEEVAKIVGINTDKITSIVFFIGAAIAGIGGILVGFNTGIEPIMGMSLLLKGVIVAIIGGMGSIRGALIGALLLGLLENFGIWHITGEWKDVIAFGLLIVFLLWRPQGIFGHRVARKK